MFTTMLYYKIQEKPETHMFQMDIRLTGYVIYDIFHFLLLTMSYEVLLWNTMLMDQREKQTKNISGK